MTKGPVALIILDGIGLREEEHGNAFHQANKPNFDRYWEQFPHTTIKASGLDVGLPEGQMGNSEVGHLNIGAGRIVYQMLTRLNKMVEDGDFHKNEVLVRLVKEAKEAGKALHIYGLLSDGGVHSHMNHMFAVLELAKQEGLEEVYVHGILDGRDVGPDTGLGFVKDAEARMADVGVGSFASISGRYYAMDRDRRWERTKLAFDASAHATATQNFDSAVEGVEASYQDEVFDEFVKPFVVDGGHGIEEGDSIFFYNFRPDRANQLSAALTNSDFGGFDRGDYSTAINFASMAAYDDSVVGEVAFGEEDVVNTLGEVVGKEGLKQLRVAETEKYPHVTYFLNGGDHDKNPGEEHLLIHSPDVATYDLQPEMSAYELTDQLLKEIDSDQHDLIVLNFANPDMVGHSGLLEPTIKAIETVDECLGKIVDLILSKGGKAVITADHGNSEQVLNGDDSPMTAHTTNEVPVIITDESIAIAETGRLADLAPTVLDLLGVDQPEEMTGQSLISDK